MKRDDKETRTNQLASNESMIFSGLAEYFHKQDIQLEFDIVLDNDIDDLVDKMSDSEDNYGAGEQAFDAGGVHDLEIWTKVQLASPEKIVALFSREEASKLSAREACLLLEFLQKSSHVTASELA